jgi:tetratricopeptide (TPR) repeat protein
MFRPIAASLVAALVLIAYSKLSAAEETDAPPLLEPAADFDALIKQLDADEFGDRQVASEKLTEAGVAAIDALKQAAEGDSREAARRAIEILTKHLGGNAEELKAAAKQALEKIAANEQRHPIAARLAKAALNPKPDAQQLPGIQLVPGQIQIQVQAIAGGGRRVRTKIVNGVKEIEAEEDGQKVKIVDDPNNGIKLEITEKKDGKETTRKIEAKDAEDLKKQDPEAHKIYEKYAKQNAVQIRALQLRPAIMPAIPAQIRPLRRLANLKEAQEQLDKAAKQLDEAVEQLNKAIENNRDADELKKAVERLEQVKKEVASLKEKLAG